MNRNIVIMLVLFLIASSLASCNVKQECGPPCPKPIERGWVITEEKIDRGNNGIINTVNTFEYNSYGDVIREVKISNDDGIREVMTQEYEYDTENRPVKIFRDYTSDGKLDDTFFISYGINGTVTKTEVDREDDGTIDGGEFYTYDEKCRVQRKESSIFGPKMIYEYKYDAQGYLYEKDVKSEGFGDSIVRLYYNEQGLLIRTELLMSDPHSVKVISYEYDERGLPIKEAINLGNNGDNGLVSYFTLKKLEDVPDKGFFPDLCPEYY